MKILVLTSRLPYPLIGGDKLTVFNLLKELKELGNDITLISLYNDEKDLEQAKNNKQFYNKLIPIKLNSRLAYINAVLGAFNQIPFIMNYFYSRKMQKVVDKEINNNDFDLILCHLIRTTEYVRKYKHIPKTVFLADAMSFAYKRRLKVNRNLFDKFKISIEYKRVLSYEKNIVTEFDRAILHSEYDKEFLSKYTNVEKIKVIPHGVNYNYFYFTDVAYNPNKIVFIGNMRTIANSDAAKYFGENVFPSIKGQNHNAKFVIIGADPRPELYEMASKIEGIEITGKVDDVRKYLEDAVLSVCPVRIAAGVQNKILESMAMGVPVVTTTAGAEGINATSDELIIADNNDSMANIILNIMNNPPKREFYSQNARMFVEKNYSWQNAALILNNILQVINCKNSNLKTDLQINKQFMI